MEKGYSIIIKLFIAIMAYFADVANMFYAVLFFMVVDWIMGIYSSWKFREKGKAWFLPSKLRKSIEKFVFYMLAIIVAHVLMKELIEVDSLTQIVAGYIALTEVKSIYNHISKVLGVEIFNKLFEIIKNQFQSKHSLTIQENDTSNYSSES